METAKEPEQTYSYLKGIREEGEKRKSDFYNTNIAKIYKGVASKVAGSDRGSVKSDSSLVNHLPALPLAKEIRDLYQASSLPDPKTTFLPEDPKA